VPREGREEGLCHRVVHPEERRTAHRIVIFGAPSALAVNFG
jgi:hypothetical protein